MEDLRERGYWRPRAGDAWMFTFRYDYQDHPGGQVIRRFTDDVELDWEIGADQRLIRLESRDW